MKITIDLKLVFKWLVMLPFLILYVIAQILGLIMDLFLIPFQWVAGFLWSFTKEVAK